ncbi:ATPase [Trypanosoma cruzi]|uniref:ATPase n=1 Tax=Trypanosoma cruzi TaxID=5693 RepID=A0A7J6XXS5_TRYCR|nr:ATPase [Trypanosoma cruzi]
MCRRGITATLAVCVRADCCHRCSFCWDYGGLRLCEEWLAAAWDTCDLPTTDTHTHLAMNFSSQITFIYFSPCLLPFFAFLIFFFNVLILVLLFYQILLCFSVFVFSCFFHHPVLFSFLLLWAITMDIFSSFLLFLFLIVSCCTLPVRGAVCLPPNCSTRTPTDTRMTTALCASPAARMRRGRDERRAEGAVTCGRAARACGAEHTFLSLLFCFLCGQGGQTLAAPHTHSHTLPPCFFCLFISRAGSPVSTSPS